MNKRKQKMKTRAHRVLFANDTPFKPKVVKSKVRYQRQPKHRNRRDDQ